MEATIFGPDEIIILLGAGASVDAGILDSEKMVREIENLVYKDDSWIEFKDLYNYIRSSIFYADGLKGKYGENVPFNIERLVNVLGELQEKEEHTLYPFVGAWNPMLQEVAGTQFEKIKSFQNKIMNVLRSKWIEIEEKDQANYYKGLLRFQNEYQHSLRVFSLNYDLCVEEICERKNVQRGFPIGEKVWDWRAFEETSEDRPPILLYKLHGSTDWRRSEGRVTYLDSTSAIKDEEVAIIFGTSYKLQYVDPFLYLAYELRRWTLDSARIIVCVGYGFNDDHINGILDQSLRQNPARKLLAVIGPSDETATAKKEQHISKQLTAQKKHIVVKACGAKEFLDKELTIASLADHFPQETNLIPELTDSSNS